MRTTKWFEKTNILNNSTQNVPIAVLYETENYNASFLLSKYDINRMTVTSEI